MAWARLDDTFPEHRKVRRLPDGAFRLHVTAICYAAHDLTDGIIHADDLEEFRGLRKPERHVQTLVDAGVWDQVSDGVWQIHDFLDYNPSRTQVEADREASRERQRRRRESRLSHAVSHGVTPGEVTRDSHRESQHPDPTPPDPTRPLPTRTYERSPFVVVDGSSSSSSSLPYRARGGDA